MSYSVFWFRRDLRFHDNAGLYHALKDGQEVIPLFIFDRNILDKLEDRDDARVTFIHQTLRGLQEKLETQGSTMLVYYGDPAEVWPQIITSYQISKVFTNRDYEPYALERDQQLNQLFQEHNIAFHTFKDHVIFEKGEVLKKDGTPYTVFTPYSKRWRAKLDSQMAIKGEGGSYFLQSYPSSILVNGFWKSSVLTLPTLNSMNFQESTIQFPSQTVNQGLIKNYDKTRNFPSIVGTSRLGIHFRFGTISIREKAKKALKLNDTYLSELIWRDFYSMILAHFPHVQDRSFRKKYDYIPWRNNESDFQKWCDGQTGYPIVDAGMRELNTTGYMHNRVRMITASFLTKHLLIDWRWGEAYFARKLLDFDLASNNGGWQWAAGSGTDAAPYFRVFNPYTQQEKFDKNFSYIKTWIPEYGTKNYIQPIVDHKLARERCLQTYKKGLAMADEALAN